MSEASHLVCRVGLAGAGFGGWHINGGVDMVDLPTCFSLLCGQCIMVSLIMRLGPNVRG